MTLRIFAVSLPALILCTIPVLAQPTMSGADAPCLRIGQIDSFAPIKGNDRAMVAIDKARHRFKLTFMSFCGGLDYNMGVGISSHGVGRLSCVSRGDQVISKDPGMAGDRCMVAKVELYTAAMEAADRGAAAAAKNH